MHVDHPPGLADLEDQGIGSHERVRAGIQRPAAERRDAKIVRSLMSVADSARRGALPETRRERPLTASEPSPPGERVVPYLLVVLLPLEAGDVVLAHGVRAVGMGQ